MPTKQKRQYQGFLIDPKNRIIEPVMYEPTLDDYYRFTQVDIIQMVKINKRGDVLVVDEEGLLRHERYFFEIGTEYPEALCNRALLTGPQNSRGRMPSVTLAWLLENVIWLGRR